MDIVDLTKKNEQDEEGIEITHLIMNKILETLGNLDTVLPHEVLKSEKCAKWFYDAVMSVYIAMGKTVLLLKDEEMVEHLKQTLEIMKQMKKESNVEKKDENMN